MQGSEHTPAPKRGHPPEKQAAKVARRFEDFEAVIGTVEAELAEGHFSAGLGKFREAVNLSRGFPPLEETVVNLAVAQAGQFLPLNWRIASSLLVEASEVDSKRATPYELWEDIELREREEIIRSALNAADAASSNGTLAQARQRLAALAARYPNDQRLQSRLKALEGSLALQVEAERRQQAHQKTKSAEASQLLARAAWARAREFEKAGFYAEALEQWETLRQMDPRYPGLDEEIARCTQLQEGPKAEDDSVQVSRGETERDQQSPPAAIRWLWMQPSDADWSRPRTVSTFIVTAAALAAAAGLIWMNYPKRVATPSSGSARPVSLARAPLARVVTQATTPKPEEVTASKPPTVTVVEVKSVIPGAGPVQVQPAQIGEEAARSQAAPAQAALEKLPLPSLSVHQSPILLPPPPVEQTAPNDGDSIGVAQALADQEKAADNHAWAAVNPRDLHSVESYLDRFPAGANRELAERALTDLRATEAAHRQSAAVLDVVRQYAAAWSARDVDSILSLQRHLDRRMVKAQLSPLKSLVMNISAASEPRIEGEQATVRCLRQVSEIFADGIEKQGPKQTVTFVLAKRDGAWAIESAKQ